MRGGGIGNITRNNCEKKKKEDFRLLRGGNGQSPTHGVRVNGKGGLQGGGNGEGRGEGDTRKAGDELRVKPPDRTRQAGNQGDQISAERRTRSIAPKGVKGGGKEDKEYTGVP